MIALLGWQAGACGDSVDAWLHEVGVPRDLRSRGPWRCAPLVTMLLGYHPLVTMLLGYRAPWLLGSLVTMLFGYRSA